MKKRIRLRASIICAFLLLCMMLVVMALADRLAIHDPTEIDLIAKFHIADAEYPFGADDYGRCVFCRCLFAIRNSVGIAFGIELLSVFIGMVLGMTAGYAGGIIDRGFNTVSNALMSFPNIILIMLIVAFLGAKTENIIIAMLLVNWIWYARLTRSLTLSLKQRQYIQAAKLNGAGPVSILARHIAPSILAQLSGQFTLSLGNVILSLAGFSFLGIGIQRPTPELGIMIADGCNLIRTNTSVLLWPGLILFLIVLNFNVLGEWISEQLRKQF